MAHRGSDCREVAKGGREEAAQPLPARISHTSSRSLSLSPPPPASNAGRVIHNQKSVLIL